MTDLDSSIFNDIILVIVVAIAYQVSTMCLESEPVCSHWAK